MAKQVNLLVQRACIHGKQGKGGFGTPHLGGRPPPSSFNKLASWFKHIFPNTANGAHPVFWDVLEGSTGLDASIRVTDGGIVYVTACRTNVFLCHSRSPNFLWFRQRLLLFGYFEWISELIGFTEDLKEFSWMETGRTLFWWFFPSVNIATLSAHPLDGFLFLKDGLSFDFLK